jgi:hypothetical protein
MENGEEELWKTHPVFDMYQGSTEGRVRFKRLGRIVEPRTTQTGYHHSFMLGARLLTDSRAYAVESFHL